MEEKDLQRLLDMLYGMVDEAKSAPFSAEKCTINRDEALDIITEIRSRMPIEIKKAQELIRAREEYIASAKKEVERCCVRRIWTPRPSCPRAKRSSAPA